MKNKKFIILIQYISRILNNWIIYLGLIPTIYDYLSAYFDLSYKFPKFFIIGFPIVVFLYASYQVYKEEYQRREDLEKKIECPTDYEIKAILSPIDFEEDKLLKRVDDCKVEAEKRLSSLPSPININQADKYKYLLSETNLYDKTKIEYNEELETYKYKLNEIMQNIDNQKEKIIQRVKELSNKFYKIDFFIKNVGITSDTDIQIEIKCLNRNIVFKEDNIFDYGMDLYHLIPNVPKEPEKPKKKGLYPPLDTSDGLYKQSLDKYKHSIPPNPYAFRKFVKIDKDSCSITIRDLHVGDEVNLFNENLIILKQNDTVSFDVTIKSKSSTRVLHPIVEIEYKKNKIKLFNYKKEN